MEIEVNHQYISYMKEVYIPYEEKKIIPLIVIGMVMNLLDGRAEENFLKLKHHILKRQLQLRNMEYINIKENINL